MKIKKILSLLILCLSINGCFNKKDINSNQLIGSWQVESVLWISKERTAGIEKAQPGIKYFY